MEGDPNERHSEISLQALWGLPALSRRGTWRLDLDKDVVNRVGMVRYDLMYLCRVIVYWYR